MNKVLTAAMVGSLFLGGASAAFAQPRYDQGQHYDQGRQYDQGRHYDHSNGWNNDWRRGGRMDNDAWNRGARVDWRRHHLRNPPRGYEWREVNGRYVLAAAATGLIADIILNAR
jgi:Ni/Co efflux regulator RcnB